MDSRVPVDEFTEFKAALQALAPNDTERARILGVDSTKTIERLRRSLPSQLRPFVQAPTLLRALLKDIDKEAA